MNLKKKRKLKKKLVLQDLIKKVLDLLDKKMETKTNSSSSDDDDEEDISEEELEKIFKKELPQSCKFLEKNNFVKEIQKTDCCYTESLARKAIIFDNDLDAWIPEETEMNLNKIDSNRKKKRNV
jgi:hypothetical protein